MSHQVQDRISLELARRIARDLPNRPEWLALALANLDRWESSEPDTAALRSYSEWRRILERPVKEICDILVAETNEGQRLRQSSPFPGALTPLEVWQIKQRVRDETRAA